MSSLIKVAIGLGTTAVAGGGGYLIYNSLKTPEINKEPSKYSEEFKETLLNFEGTTHKTNWVARLTSLKKERTDSNLTQNLKTIRDKQPETNVWEELRDWCKEIINTESKGENDKEYKNIQNYCTFSIEEKAGTIIKDGQDSNYSKGHEKLLTINNNNELDEDLIAAKGKKNNEGYKAVKDWCVKAYSKPYKGESDKDFKNVKKFCVTNPN